MKNIHDLIKKSERIVVLFDIDTDGVTSAKIISESLKRLNCAASEFHPATPHLLNNPDFILGIKRSEADLIIIADVELRNNSLFLKKNKHIPIVVFDHHSINFLPKPRCCQNLSHFSQIFN